MAAERAPTDPEEILGAFPDLAGETRVAYRFLAETIRRDTEKWKAKQRRYQEAAARRGGESSGKSAPDRGDISWMRRYIADRRTPEGGLD